MPDRDDLTPSESALLIVLMAEARDLSNRELDDRFGLRINGKSRVKLNNLKYVESWKQGQMYVHRLGDAGWARCYRQLNFDSPRARALGAALSSLYDAIHRHLARQDLSLADAFGEEADGQPTTAGVGPGEGATAGSLPDQVRSAYRSLARHPGAWVSVADLRARLAGAGRAEVDAALRDLERSPDVSIVPESNQKALSGTDRDAAVRIGGQDKHFLAIGV